MNAELDDDGGLMRVCIEGTFYASVVAVTRSEYALSCGHVRKTAYLAYILIRAAERMVTGALEECHECKKGS